MPVAARNINPTHNLSRLTSGELLVLWRRRQTGDPQRRYGRTGGSMTRAEAATLLDVTPELYALMELDLAKSGMRIVPTNGELCYIARRRSGLTIKQVTADLGVTKMTLHNWEARGFPKLVEFWTWRGYQFP